MIWLALLSIPYMTLLSRMHGGGKPKLPLGLDAWLLAAPYFIFTPIVGWYIIPAYLTAVLAIRMGHGRLWEYDKTFEIGSEPEKIEAIIPDSWPVKYQKMTGMLLTGILVTLVLAICLISQGHALSGFVLFLSGGAKALAYLAPKTETSEYLRGSFLGLGVTVAWYICQF